MSRDWLLALDLGTTGVRALLLGREGEVRAWARRPLTSRYPRPGWLEQDPGEWWRESVAVLHQVLREARVEARQVAALGLSTQRASAVAWDAERGEPLAPAIGWQDRRTQPRVAELAAQGLHVGTLASATKYEWLLRRLPEVSAAARAGRLRLGTPDAWLGDRLTGGAAHVTDPGQASCTALFSPARGAWSGRALRRFGLEESWLPGLAPTSAVVGETPSALLGAPIPVASRAGDQQAACFAQGVRRPGDAKLTLGTAAMLDLHCGAQPAPPLPGAFPLLLWQLPGEPPAHCVEGSVLTAGAVVEWLVELGLLPAADQLDRVAGAVESSEGVVFVPALQGLGTPYLDPRARGFVGGLSRGSRSAHWVRAALDGVAQRCVDVCDALDLDGRPIPADGGLSRSALLLRRIADLGGRPLLRAREAESSAVGAAWLAGLAVGWPRPPGLGRAQGAERFWPGLSDERRQAQRARWRALLRRVSETATAMR